MSRAIGRSQPSANQLTRPRAGTIGTGARCLRCAERDRLSAADGGMGWGRIGAAALACLIGLFIAPAAQSAIELELVVDGFERPLFLGHAGDGSGRLFVLEQAGRIRIVEDGGLAPQPFLDLTDQVLSGGERGLLGLAFHPDFATNRRFFVDYTRQPDGATVIAEFRATGTNPNRALLTVAQPFSNHNGGMLAFGPDGHLYIALGDGGGIGDPGNRAQNPSTLLGKILRIDVDGALPYTIRRTTRSPTAAGGPRSSRWACATLGGSRSIAARATCSRATSARIRSRRST